MNRRPTLRRAVLVFCVFDLVLSQTPVCNFSADGYTLSWDFNPNFDVQGNPLVNFRLSAPVNSPSGDSWTGMGINDQGCGENCMLNADMLIVTASSQGQLEFVDMYTGDSRTLQRDSQQDMLQTSGSVVGGVITAQFTRSLLASDDNDKGMEQFCVTFLYPTSGGPVSEGKIQAHTARPKTEEICNIPACLQQGISLPTGPVNPAPQPPMQPGPVQPQQPLQPAQPIQPMQPLQQGGCPMAQDPAFCLSYFNDYLQGQIGSWMQQNGLTDSQQWMTQACGILQSGQNGQIPSQICCNTFNSQCGQYMNLGGK